MEDENKSQSGLPVYLTYGQLNDEKTGRPKLYKYKVKAYSDGTYKVIEYQSERMKTPQKLTTSSGSNSELTDEEREIRLKESRRSNLYKTKNKLRDYARNNHFDKFWTLTFDPKICGDSDDYRFSEMEKWLRKMRDKYGKFNYLAVPERHKSGQIHWHMMTGYFEPVLVDSGKQYKRVPIYNCPEWEFGFTNVQKVRSKKRISNYVSKYITKDLMESPARRNKKKYWASRSLELPEVFSIAEEVTGLPKAGFESEICKIYEMEKSDFNKCFGKRKMPFAD